MFGLFKTANKHKNIAEKIYSTVSIQSRNGRFYSYYKVKDDVDGRFDMLVLHAILVNLRLEQEEGTQNEGKANKLAQLIYDEMFANMDSAVREMGIADIRVGRQIKNMMQAYYGRKEKYNESLLINITDDDISSLESVMLKNIYGSDKLPDNLDKMKLRMLARYIVDSHEMLKSIDFNKIYEDGMVYFPQPVDEEIIDKN